jgi:mannose-6-phosphate isomerase
MAVHSLRPLTGALQDYAWGGYHFIPDLLGEPAVEGHPVAELWMGTHHRGKALVMDADTATPLDEWLALNPQCLGEKAMAQFNSKLPFLFKVLDVREMLSIQTHPTKAQAERGFAAENAAGVPLDAPHRNFKDDNHKPEVMVALTDFWLLHGFRPLSNIKALLEKVDAFAPLKPYFEGDDLRKLYHYIMQMPQSEVERLLEPLYDKLAAQIPSDKDTPDFWAWRAMATETGPVYDRGVFSIYLFNLVYLRPGQGIFQEAGIPHAYLEGVNVELMANSDNVFRGGLTPKHVDVPQLMKHIVLKPVVPRVLEGEDVRPFEQAYTAPVADFQLNRVHLPPSETYTHKPTSIELLLLLNGSVVGAEGQIWQRGQVLLACANQPYTLRAEEECMIYKALVP